MDMIFSRCRAFPRRPSPPSAPRCQPGDVFLLSPRACGRESTSRPRTPRRRPRAREARRPRTCRPARGGGSRLRLTPSRTCCGDPEKRAGRDEKDGGRDVSARYSAGGCRRRGRRDGRVASDVRRGSPSTSVIVGDGEGKPRRARRSGRAPGSRIIFDAEPREASHRRRMMRDQHTSRRIRRRNRGRNSRNTRLRRGVRRARGTSYPERIAQRHVLFAAGGLPLGAGAPPRRRRPPRCLLRPSSSSATSTRSATSSPKSPTCASAFIERVVALARRRSVLERGTHRKDPPQSSPGFQRQPRRKGTRGVAVVAAELSGARRVPARAPVVSGGGRRERAVRESANDASARGRGRRPRGEKFW